MNRLYDFDFVSKPQVAEKEALFIPTGFDSLNLIRELCRGNVLVQGADGSDLSYTEVMVPLFQVLKDDKGRLGQVDQTSDDEYFECEDWQLLL